MNNNVWQFLEKYIRENYNAPVSKTGLFSRKNSYKGSFKPSKPKPAFFEDNSAVDINEPAFNSTHDDSYIEKSQYSGSDSKSGPENIDDYLKYTYRDDNIAKKVTQYMYEKDITTGMIYERCFIDRKHISKITKGDYHPSKRTMLALCIGLQLTKKQGEELLLLAGYSFSYNNYTDMIISFALENEAYNIDDINEALYKYHEKCIGE